MKKIALVPVVNKSDTGSASITANTPLLMKLGKYKSKELIKLSCDRKQRKMIFFPSPNDV